MVTGTAETTSEYANDAALLQRFAKSRDEAAFAELVRRHGRLVWGVCRRRLARREDAEDAFQAAFLILAVKAHAIRSADALPAWLHRTACRAANRVASSSPVEASHDVPTDGLDAFAEVARREAATAIDEELVRLPERYRNAVVLFHLEGLERQDVATRLGLSEPTVKALLSRGRALLRTRLARRGLALPMLLPLTLDPLPVAAAESTCRLALSLTRAGLRPWDLATLHLKSLRPMTAFLSNKFVAATFVGAACATLFFATRGDANASGNAQDAAAHLDTAFSANEDGEPTLLALADTAAVEAAVPATSAAGEPQAELAPPQIIVRSPREENIREALEKDTDLQFPNTPLRQALQFLADVHEINIIIDEQALEEEGLTVDDNVDIVLSGITLRSALDILLDRYDLTYVIEDEVMKITTQAAAERRVSTQAFDVSSLIERGGSADEIARVVEELLSEAQQQVSAGQDPKANEMLPTPRVIPYHDRLIVKASGANLKEIEEILELLWVGRKSFGDGASNRTTDRSAGRADDSIVKSFLLENAVASEAGKVLETALPIRQGDQSLRITVDERTNSLIVSGSEEQLKIAEALLLRLDESDAKEKPETNETNRRHYESPEGRTDAPATESGDADDTKLEPLRPTISLDTVRFDSDRLLITGHVTNLPAGTLVTVRPYAVDEENRLAWLPALNTGVTELGEFGGTIDNSDGWPKSLRVIATVDTMEQVSVERDLDAPAGVQTSEQPTTRFQHLPPESGAVADFNEGAPVTVPSGSSFLVTGTVRPIGSTSRDIELQSPPPNFWLFLYPKGGNPRLTPHQNQRITLLPYDGNWWFETQLVPEVPAGDYVLRLGREGGPAGGPQIAVAVTKP